MAESVKLKLPFNVETQDEGEKTHNTALSVLDAFVMLTVKSRTTTAQPVSPSDGDAYLIPTGATGTEWPNEEGKIGLYIDNDFYVGWFADEAGDFIAPSAGMRCFVEDEDQFLIYDGTKWIPWDGHTIKPSDTARSSTTTAAADPHLVAPLAANRKYVFEIVAYCIGNAAGDLKIQISTPAGATLVYSWQRMGSTDGEVKNDGTDSGTISMTGTSWPSQAEAVVISGEVTVSSTAGDLELKWAQATSNATATTIKAGSFMSVRLAAA